MSARAWEERLQPTGRARFASATRRRRKKAPADSINSYYALFVLCTIPFSVALPVFYFLFLRRQSMLWKFSLGGKKHARRGVGGEKRWIKGDGSAEVEGDA